ncbi:MAG TPA: hypothetical protein ENO22_03405 [candidate division Zixibacteria bacterium]|nr:hypothetical protein [candidate division Zixibacteria bacterium]HEQ98371.1 hypothetical protein [candidate division Zixibacteria bacterium]
MLKNLLLVLFMFVLATPLLSARTFDFMKLSDEVSFYFNSNDNFNTKGRTLQIVAINQVKIGTWFQVEFTGDFNWETTIGVNYDYYIEVGVVKKVWRNLSFNYQRIHGSFVDEPINQFGIRLAL